MIEITFSNKKGKEKLKSSTVEEIISLMADIEYVKDISDSVREKSIMVFDCKLDKSVFKYEYLDDEFYEEVEIGEEYYQMLFEDIKLYVREICEDIENELQDEFYDGIRCESEIYDLDETFTDVKFVCSVCFKDIKRLQLVDFTRRVSKKQLQGSSKYMN